jgi:hypothetical protein
VALLYASLSQPVFQTGIPERIFRTLETLTYEKVYGPQKGDSGNNNEIAINIKNIKLNCV